MSQSRLSSHAISSTERQLPKGIDIEEMIHHFADLKAKKKKKVMI